MKTHIDENLPPALARAIDAIARSYDHEVVHVREFVKPGTADLELFEAAIRRDIRVHVTQDHHQRKPVERDAIARLGRFLYWPRAGARSVIMIAQPGRWRGGQK